MRKILGSLWGARRAILLWGLLFGLGAWAGEHLMTTTIPEMRPMNEPLIHRIVMWSLVVFVIAAAVPFVPGAEIGFALLLLFGGQASFLVYTGMVGALLLSYGIARLVPLGYLGRGAEWLRLKRLAAMVRDLDAMPRHDRISRLTERASGRFGPLLLKNRYLLLVVLLNLPGNSVLGGGGGLAFLAGASGMFRFWPYLLTVLVAVAPFPLGFHLMGGDQP